MASRAPARKPGRPSRGQAADLDEKALAARLLLVDREPVALIERFTGRTATTLYSWVRQVCNSEHVLAEELRPLAEARKLLEPARRSA